MDAKNLIHEGEEEGVAGRPIEGVIRAFVEYFPAAPRPGILIEEVCALVVVKSVGLKSFCITELVPMAEADVYCNRLVFPRVAAKKSGI